MCTCTFRPVYTKRQHQCCDNSPMTLAILFSLKTMESLQNGLKPYSGVTPLFSIKMHSSRMRTICCSGCLGGCLPRGKGVSVQREGEGGVCLGGVCLGCVCQEGGVCPEGVVPPCEPNDWQDKCKNITSPQLHLQMVMRTVLLASSQSCPTVDSDAWCKWTLTKVNC